MLPVTVVSSDGVTVGPTTASCAGVAGPTARATAYPGSSLKFEVTTYEEAQAALATQIAGGNSPDLAGPVGVGGIALYDQRVGVTRNRFERLAPASHQNDVGALFRHAPGNRRADAGAAAGDESRLAGKSHFDPACRDRKVRPSSVANSAMSTGWRLVRTGTLF